MELRQYWNVIWRRRWLVLGIVLLTTLLSGYMFWRAPLSYEAEARFITRQAPDAQPVEANLFIYHGNAYWIGSEFLVDDYTEIVKSDAFAASVLEIMGPRLTLGKAPDQLTRADIKGAMEVDRKHRELRVKVTAPTRQEAREFSDAVAMVLTGLTLKPIRGEMVDDRPLFTQIDEATPDEIMSSRFREVISAAIRVLVGIVAALALAFLLEYLDRSVRDERDAARVLEMPVIGAIPRG